MREIMEKVSEILAHEGNTVIMEGKPVVFAAEESDMG